jgi:hypothetical protein
MNEQDYERGNRMAWVRMLQVCLRELDIDDPERARSRWIVEREQAVSMLRQVCARHGDNEWPNDGSLADVIEKHLWRHLEP